MKPTAQLRQLGQSMRLDNIARELPTSGQLPRIDIDALAATLQKNGANRFGKSWDYLLGRGDDQVAVVGS